MRMVSDRNCLDGDSTVQQSLNVMSKLVACLHNLSMLPPLPLLAWLKASFVMFFEMKLADTNGIDRRMAHLARSEVTLVCISQEWEGRCYASLID